MAESRQYLLPKTQGRYVTVTVTDTSGEVYRVNDDGTRTIYADYFEENGSIELKSSSFASEEFNRNLAQSSQSYRQAINTSINQANGVTPTGSDPDQQNELGTSVPTNVDANLQSTGPSDVVLRYPANNTGGYDFLQITTYRRNPLPNLLGGNGFDLRDVDDVSVTPVDAPIIALPMHPGISDSNSVDWGADQLNPLQLAGAGIAANAIRTGASGDAMGALTGMVKDAISAGKQLISGIDNEDIISYFAGQAVGANIFTRSTGKVINPNLELLFRGPQLRTFSYNYKFTPRDPDEARVIKAIIRHFKKNMAVQRNSPGLFLETPNIFELKYIYSGGGQHPFLNKIKKCALTNFNVEYTPDGSYMTYRDGSMTSYGVTMQFSELTPIYSKNYDKDTDNMGY